MRFYLFTINNVNMEQQIFTGNVNSLIKSNLNADFQTRILIHGWDKNWMTCPNGLIKDAYLKKGKFNIIVVDWGDWAFNTNYLAVTKNIFGVIGKTLANFTKFLNKHGHVSFNDMYLIGHGLGAHLAGAAGLYIQPSLFNTIYALDPAGPGFQNNPPDQRLDKSHAKYVEQISTNMDGYGYLNLIGHAGFYPNYGRIQNYCVFNEIDDVMCFHYTSYYYFAETINTKIGFCATRCWYHYTLTESISKSFGCLYPKCYPKILMGGEPSVPKKGNFYVKTNDNPPFASCNCFFYQDSY